MTRDGILEMPGAHLDEGALVRRLDGELDPAEAADMETHLAACTRCRARLAEIASSADRLSSALRLIDPEHSVEDTPHPADAWHDSPIWRAAAVVAFVAGLALAITPVRAWISERLGLAGDRDGTELSVSAETPRRTTAEETGVRVAFVKPIASRGESVRF